MQYHKDWKNNKNYRRNSVNQGCLWAIVSLWATVDVAIGSTKVALGAWIVTHIEGTTNIALGLMALGYELFLAFTQTLHLYINEKEKRSIYCKYSIVC